MHFMQIESVFQTKTPSEPAKNRFSVALVMTYQKVIMPVWHMLFIAKQL